MFKERRLGAAVRSCCCLISRPSRIRRSFRSGIRIVSTSDHVNQVLELLRKLMEYRSSDVRHRLEKVGRAASMLHMDVLLLIYHFARSSLGNIMEIGPYVGGSAIAAAFGARESGTRKKIISIEADGSSETFPALEQEHHQRFEEEPLPLRCGGRCDFDQPALLRCRNDIRSSSDHRRRRSRPIHFWSTITSDRRRQPPSGRRLIHLCLRVDFSRLDMRGGALGSASGSATKSCPQSALRKSADHTLIESNLWCYGRNPLTTRCFTRKVSTHFYHARPATRSVRPYK